MVGWEGTEEMGKTFKIITLGCKVNQYESACLAEALSREGWRNVSHGEAADLEVINTCIVTEAASSQSRQAVRRAIRENPMARIAVTGCYAQVFPDELTQIKGVDLVAGNAAKGELPQLLGTTEKIPLPCNIQRDFQKSMPFEFLPAKGLSDRTRAYLKIQDGCRTFCSYCIVPFARGPLRSLEPLKVIEALGSLSDEGYKECVLTGIHLGKYGVDLVGRMDLKDLLSLIGKEQIPMRIRLSSVEPKEVTLELIEMIATDPWLCRHFHVPLQSGDDHILQLMNREYTRREYASLIERIHQRIPQAAIGADVMAGFPGEDETAYRNTYDFIKDLPISYLHVFPYSPRKGTKAASLPDRVEKKLIRARAEELRSLGREKREVFYGSCVGSSFEVLAEGWDKINKKTIKGFTDNYLPVIFPSSELIRNRMVAVKMERVEKGKIIGALTEEAKKVS